MTEHVEGTFEVTSWDEEQAKGLDDAAKVTRATIGQRLAGGIEAETVSDTVMAYREDGTADYVGFERVVGRLGRRSGSFVLQTVGTFDGQEARATTSVVPGSGTGDLVRLHGTGTVAALTGTKGTFSLDFDLD
jgi:Protein of unknown function (DUF3224)